MSCAQAESTRRLFFALWPDAALCKAIDTLSLGLVGKRARRVTAANLHITLAFPGSVPRATSECLEAGATAISGAPFVLDIDRIGYWPRPRILWAGPTHTPPQLWSLVGALRQVLEQCGITPETRPFQAHLTLARKISRGVSADRIEPLQWAIDGFCLVESVTAPTGPEYRVLQTWPLRQ